jgi:hypothetical protein
MSVLTRCSCGCCYTQGRKIVWYAAIFGTVLAVSRALITEEHKVFCPEAAMADVVKHTHYFPRHWRNRCHLKAVQAEFEELFQVKPPRRSFISRPVARRQERCQLAVV